MLFNNFNRLFELLKFFSSILSFDVVKEVYTMLLASFRFSFSLRLMHFSQTKKYICFGREKKIIKTTEFSTLLYYIHTNLINFFMLFYICYGCFSKMFSIIQKCWFVLLLFCWMIGNDTTELGYFLSVLYHLVGTVDWEMHENRTFFKCVKTHRVLLYILTQIRCCQYMDTCGGNAHAHKYTGILSFNLISGFVKMEQITDSTLECVLAEYILTAVVCFYLSFGLLWARNWYVA